MKHKSHKYAVHKEDAYLREKAGEIFEAMGYEVQYDRCFPGCKIDIFANQEKTIISEYGSMEDYPIFRFFPGPFNLPEDFEKAGRKS